MTTMTETHNATTTSPSSPEAAQPARPRYKVTGLRVLRSEWAKLWTLRSTWITLALGLVFLIAFGVIAAAQYGSGSGLDDGGPGGDLSNADALGLSLFGISLAQMAFGILGVMVTAGEYSTGMIRSTLAAVPRRLPVLWSKSAVFGLVTFAVGTIGALVAFLIGNELVSGTAAELSLSDSGVVRSLLGAGVYLGLIAVIGTALGALFRSVAGGISVLVGTLMLVPNLTSLLPNSWEDDVNKYLPTNAGESLYSLTHDAASLSPTAGLLVLLGWSALALAGAAYRLVRKDA
ncbi:ABC transporter permease OS=Streptomyces aurantiogriseus OX=66870 GN=GCM10010251_25590 PE=4 SV=1 [Streptomyces aurantiogriseus]|uniref:ABC transporter permease n=2 Tax=Streptomyces aurantiogriseus TaxID=66870 RepID=A0A918C696_9ACTN|nr:ABC transporter permease [Streptomyces aurantiogriseus]